MTRQRTTRRAHIPDLDYLGPDALLRFYQDTWEPTLTERARLRFPERPIRFLKASEDLGRYALCRYRALMDSKKHLWWLKQADRIYGDLPRWAQFRRKLNVRAMVVPDQKFRKNPPRNGDGRIEVKI